MEVTSMSMHLRFGGDNSSDVSPLSTVDSGVETAAEVAGAREAIGT